MADAFIQCGAGVFVGYKGFISSALGLWADADAQQFFYDTCHKGYTTSQAAKVKQWYDPLNSRSWNGYGDLRLVSGTTDAKSMSVVVYSPAEIHLTDPLGRHVGVDPGSMHLVLEIPDAIYVGGSEFNETEPRMVWIPEVLNGTYDISLIGIGIGSYNLTVGVSSLSETNMDSHIDTISTNQTITFEAIVSGTQIKLNSVSPVGGVWIPVDKFSLLTPYIAMISTIILAVSISVAYIKIRKKQ